MLILTVKNSSKFKDKSQSEILSLITYDMNLPLIKESIETTNLLTPKFSFRYSPNDTKNIKSETRFLSADNIFSLNRIGFDETIESGTSLQSVLTMKIKKKMIKQCLVAELQQFLEMKLMTICLFQAH